MTTVAWTGSPSRPSLRVRSALRTLVTTRRSASPLVARVVLGLVLVPQGAQHALGLLGGYGFAGTLGWMTKTLGFPAPLAALAIVVELVAPYLLVVGLGGRLAALGVVGPMLGAAKSHAANGFFMNWFGALPAGHEGFEYHLLAIALALVVVLAGSGAASIDAAIDDRLARRA